MTFGLTVGKFWPVHAGHVNLIRTTIENSDETVVMVVREPGQVPSAEKRAEWVKEIFPQVTVMVIDQQVPDTSEVWGKFTLELLGRKPDVVFTSEEYGFTWAEAMGSQHYLVDMARMRYPVSGTLVRANPYQMWDFLPPPVRRYYALRVCIVGPESCGKTTLAENLAKHYDTSWVPEYARYYGEQQGLTPETWDKDEGLWGWVMENQPKLENFGAMAANRVVFCDTDLMTTSVWHEDYRGFRNDDLYAESLKYKYDLYLLCSPTTEWVDDGMRNRPDNRDWFYDRFQSELWDRHANFARINAVDWKDRTDQAISEVNHLLLSRKAFWTVNK